ncbi:unnamed protein product [Somion occarium]|uniref:Uncharacterized protein n=1 Tax=Somion occarium TaxID=3059160 RepID=A0ABP1CI18_9APHY
MSQRALRHVNVVHSRYIHCTRYLRSYSAQAAVRQLPQDTDAPPDDTLEPSTSKSSNNSSQILDRAAKSTLVIRHRGKKTEDASAHFSGKVSGESSLMLKERRHSLKTEAYLAKLHAGGVKPTIADLEMFRLDKHARPDTRRYVEQHNSIVDSLCRAFTRQQLREFLELYNVDPASIRPKHKKTQYAEAILEDGWGWPSLQELEKSKRERTEVSAKLYPMTRSELFLMLGRDGSQMLELSREYNVNVSLSSEPLALRVEGIIAALNSITQRISQLRESFVNEVYQLPTATSVPQDLIKRISRLANAFMENVGPNGEIKIHARSEQSLENAKRLAARAMHELYVSSHIPSLSYKPPESAASHLLSSAPHAYSLYPFLSPRTLPWTMNTNGAFRFRKVGEWLVQAQGEDLERTGGLAGSRGKLYSREMSSVDLKSAFMDMLPDTNQFAPRTKKIKALLGHMLVATTSSVQQTSLTPPLKGYHQYPKIMQWMETNDVRTSFIPSLPSSLVDVNPRKQKILHRLVYKSYESISDTDGPELLSDSGSGVRMPELRTVTFEVMLAQPKTPVYDPGFKPESGSEDAQGHDIDTETFHTSLSAKASSTLSATSISLAPHCWTAHERILDVMMPDRPMDMRLSFSESVELAEKQMPQVLQDYLSDLRRFLQGTDAEITQPLAPLLLTHNGENYILHSSASVRQSIDELPAYDEGRPDPSLAVVSESVVDLESSQKATSCEVRHLHILEVYVLISYRSYVSIRFPSLIGNSSYLAATG